VIPDWTEERRKIVETQLRGRGVRDERVLAAMLAIPRERFIPYEERVMAYSDAPVSIGFGQTISQPYMTALMAEALELTGAETVLEIGSGSGYAAAVLSLLAERVITVEVIPALVAYARENLKAAGFSRNITVIRGDGSLGYAPLAPYDAITVAAAAPEVPPALLQQLKDPGRLVIPVGDSTGQELRVITKRGGRITTRVPTLCRFVPLRAGGGVQ
jgi:protein-L-isoaspartate(D-aspartate) O-methyltransferase